MTETPPDPQVPDAPRPPEPDPLEPRRWRPRFRQLDPVLIQAACYDRPPERRTPVPKVGDLVRYRHWMDTPTVAAVVLAVLDMDGPAEDPWPQLELRVRWSQGAKPMIVRTREARVEGTAGWLPL